MRRALMTLLMLASFNCASLPTVPRIDLPTIPDVPTQIDGALPQVIDTALTLLEQAVSVEERAANAYLSIAASVPAPLDKQIRAGFVNVSDLILNAVELLRAGVKSWPELRPLLQSIVIAMNSVTAWLREIPAGGASSSPWKPLVNDLIGLVTKAALAKAGIK